MIGTKSICAPTVAIRDLTTQQQEESESEEEGEAAEFRESGQDFRGFRCVLGEKSLSHKFWAWLKAT